MKNLLVLLILCLPTSAFALDVQATTTDVTFHISHPAKEYDAVLLPGGATVTGRFDPADLAATGCDVSIRVDKFNSDNVRRDSHMMESLEGLVFPTIEWSVKGLSGIEGAIKPGTYSARAAGPLKIRDLTLDHSVPIEITVADDGTITVTSSFSVSLTEFQIERATLVFVPIEDEVPIQVTMVFPAGKEVLYVEPPPAPVPETAAEEAPEPPAE